MNYGSTASPYEPSPQNEIYLDNEQLLFDNYSTSEQVIGTWVNGKPIYRKYIDCGTMPNSTQKGVNHGISNLSDVIRVELMMTNGTYFIPGPNGNPSALALCTYVYVDRIAVQIRTGQDRSTYTGFAIIEYTKTTD